MLTGIEGVSDGSARLSKHCYGASDPGSNKELVRSAMSAWISVGCSGFNTLFKTCRDCRLTGCN